MVFMLKIAIIMPAYNEERRIGKTLESYGNYFNRLVKNKVLDYELLVVINNTKDRTEEIVRGYMKKNPCVRYLNFKRKGKGFAVIEGFKEALKRDNELIGFVDADMATSPEEYHRLINGIKEYDGAIADRYMKGSIVIPKPSYKRLAAKKLFNFVIRSFLLVPFGDTQCGAKLFRRRALEETLPHLSMSGWAFDADLIYSMKKSGFRIRAVPTIWIDKEYSTINFWQAGPWMAIAVIRLRILNSPFRRFVRIYDKFIGFIPK